MCVRVMVPFAALHFQLSTCRRMTVLVERGTSACENKDQHVKTKRRWGVSWRKVIFPVCLCSITCSQTRHVDSMFDEDRHTASWHTVVPFAGWKALVVKEFERRHDDADLALTERLAQSGPPQHSARLLHTGVLSIESASTR